MTLYRATVLDTPRDPFVHGAAALASDLDGGLLVRDGVIVARGPYTAFRAEHPDELVEDRRGGILVPGFVDAHVHYPQIRAIGGLGMPLLEWLERCALPEECRLADVSYAAAVAEGFVRELVRSGTTTALVFGAHFAPAMDTLFAATHRSGLAITAGLVLSDRGLPGDLLRSPSDGRQESLGLIQRWHGRGRLRYAVSPRFSLSTSPAMLEVCAELLGPELRFTSHLNENGAEVEAVADLWPGSAHYLDSYHRFGLVTDRSVFAHNVHATDAELDLLGGTGAWVAHCPTSNAALGSGVFPLRRHLERGVGVALGSDVGAGTGLFVPKEALQAYFMQQLLGPEGVPLTSVHLLSLATRAGARALGLDHEVGDFTPGKVFDAVWVHPRPGSTLAVNLDEARDPTDALARVFALAAPSDVAEVWVAGVPRLAAL